ncbi:hypothetical protein HK097_000946 [Rhizophlyctis rosea]|uniref:Uncharacterized protein n=1 Tax=Rhizophlyctis rosea TaxID=64517 RepID=A0AAD5SCY2_9FUNG|nr:hypothetical protein HK097_000946 [Rhizophlyctis rosea]
MGWPKRCTYEARKPGRVGDDWSGFEVGTEKKEARAVGNHGAFCIIDLASGIVFIDKYREHYDYAKNSEQRNYYSEFATVTQHLKVQTQHDDIKSRDVPWSHQLLPVGRQSRPNTQKYILSCKLHFPSAETKAALISEITEVIEKGQDLHLDERPDFEEYMELLKRCYDREEFWVDRQFDF